MATNTIYDPINMNEFSKMKLNKAAIGIQATPTLNNTTNIDYVVTDDVLMTGGGSLLVQGATFGDSVDFQIMAPDGMGGFILVKQFVTSWFLDPSVVNQQVPKAVYPAKIPAGFKLRVIYNSTGLIGTINVAINFDLEKILV